MSLTPDQAERAREMRAQEPPVSWMMIACFLGVSQHYVRKAIDPAFVEYRKQVNEQVKLGKAPIHRGMGKRKRHCSDPEASGVYASRTIMVPGHVLLDQERANAYEPSSATAAICGDPPPWRSALAQRQGA